jgi:hypothetical protein
MQISQQVAAAAAQLQAQRQNHKKSTILNRFSA